MSECFRYTTVIKADDNEKTKINQIFLFLFGIFGEINGENTNQHSLSWHVRINGTFICKDHPITCFSRIPEQLIASIAGDMPGIAPHFNSYYIRKNDSKGMEWNVGYICVVCVSCS